jgi:hypothetical protein
MFFGLMFHPPNCWSWLGYILHGYLHVDLDLLPAETVRRATLPLRRSVGLGGKHQNSWKHGAS